MTVKELKERLKHWPDNAKVHTFHDDLGAGTRELDSLRAFEVGYDTCDQEDADVMKRAYGVSPGDVILEWSW